jgi:hypothetical protein
MLRCLIVCLPNYPFFFNGHWHIFLRTSHKIKPPPSYGLWYLSMDVWLTHRFNSLIHIFRCVHEGECIAKHDAVQDSFTSIARDVGFHVLCEHSCSFNFISLVIVSTSGYCAYNIWYTHIGRCSHCWFDLFKSCFTSLFFSRSGHEDCNLGKGCVILQPTPWGWFYPPCSKNIYMFTLVG